MYNPWSGYRVTGNWYAHRTYSYGGTDYPLAYGTPLRAPASGTLTNNGWVGSAGRRATLRFDTPVKRRVAASPTPMYGGRTPYYEHNCDMVSLVFQHAKGYLGSGWYREGALIGYSGASANGREFGGDVHLHIHGLCIHGARVDWLKFQGSTTSGTPSTPIEKEEDMANVTDAQLEQLLDAAKLIQDGVPYLKNRVGGSQSNPSLTEETRFIKNRVGGSGDAINLTDLGRLIRDMVDTVPQDVVAALSNLNDEELAALGLRRI